MIYNKRINSTKCVKMRYNKGFEYMGKPYVWKNKIIFRLPYEINNRCYGFLKVAKWIKKGNHVGFVLGNHKKSFAQLKKMTTDVDVEIKESDCIDVPF